jgi:hypothetical protein
MPYVSENAWILLRAMKELDTTIGNQTRKSQLQPCTDLSDHDYDQAANFLHSMGYIEGSVGEDRDCWLSPEGVEYLQEQMRGRMKLSWTAERIIRHMIKQIPYHGIPILWTEIQQALGLDDTQYTKACQELADYQLIKNVGAKGHYFGSITVTELGRLAARENFQWSDSAPTQIHAGAIFQGPVTDSNIQAVAQAIGSQIEQAISQNDPDSLRQTIAELMEQLVDAVKQDLTMDQLSVYTKTAQQVREEIQKPKPNPALVHRLFPILSFAGDLDGTLELGKKGLELAVKVAPLILTFLKAIQQLIV